MNPTYQLADSVLHRVVQPLQLALLTETDVADYMRQIRLCATGKDGDQALVCTVEYEAQFQETLTKLQAELDAKMAQSPVAVSPLKLVQS